MRAGTLSRSLFGISRFRIPQPLTRSSSASTSWWTVRLRPQFDAVEFTGFLSFALLGDRHQLTLQFGCAPFLQRWSAVVRKVPPTSRLDLALMSKQDLAMHALRVPRPPDNEDVPQPSACWAGSEAGARGRWVW